MCHWTVTTLMFIFHAFYRKLLLTLQGITRASVYYQAFLSSSRTWHWWGQGLGQTFGLNMCLCLSTLHSSMDFTEPDSWLGELNPYWLRQCLLIMIMGRGKSHLKELLWMPQNWTKTCVGSDEGAWVFFFFNIKICLFILGLDRKHGALQMNWVMHNLCHLVLGDPGPVTQPVSSPPHLHCCGSAQGEGQSSSGTCCCGSLGCGKNREGRLYLFPVLGRNKMFGHGCRQCKLWTFCCPRRLSLWKLKVAEALVWQQAWWDHSLLLPSCILIIKEFLMEKHCTNPVPSQTPPFSASSETHEVTSQNFRDFALNKYLIQSKIMAKDISSRKL